MVIYAQRYERIQSLGRGMTGEVFLVRDTKTGLNCALKILNTTFRGVAPTALTSFQSEFAILKDLNHPSIAKVFDAGFEEYEDHITGNKKKLFYITTEFIEGQDLLKTTENEPMHGIENLFVQALRALNYLHNQKVFHLDIKPTNILVSKNENGALVLKLIDFGLANFYHRQHEKRTPDSTIIAGTAPYLSPEIIKGENPDGRADLYSLGCAFFKAFTRELPFSGSSHKDFHEKHLHQMPQAPSLICATLPEYLDKILLKLLVKEPASRYQTAAEVIGDLNLLSSHSYPVETAETKMSYVPEKGKMVGREKEFNQFEAVYHDRLIAQSYHKKPYLIIKGNEGCGKTRFIQECKNLAQKDFIQTITWKELMELNSEKEITNPCLILGDEEPFDLHIIEYIEVFFEKLPLLAIFTSTHESPMVCEENILYLKNFTREETEEYLLKATGLSQMPKPMVDIISQRTLGNPLYLTEYIKALFEQDFFKDAHGTWSQQMLEDLGQELQNIGATEFIKKRLNLKLQALNLIEPQWNLLFMMALYGRPTLTEITEMSGSHDVEENLRFLVKVAILQPDLEFRYIFTNPLYKEVLLEKMDDQLKADLCDHIADYYEQQKVDEDLILYFRGRGNRAGAPWYLLKLARKKREELLYDEAIKNLLTLLEKQKVTASQQHEAMLELGELCIEMGKFVDAEKWLLQFMDKNDWQKSDEEKMMQVKALEQLGLSYYRRNILDKAKSYYDEAIQVLKNNVKKSAWMEVILKNRIALNELEMGHTHEAETIFNETWKIWKDQLSSEDKFLAAKSNIDTVHSFRGEFQKAIFYLKEFLKVLEQAPYTENYPLVLFRIGSAYLKANDLDQTETYLNRCLDVLKQRKTPHWLHLAYNELGILEERRKNFQEALSYYQHAFNLMKKMPVGLAPFAVVFNIANLNLTLKNFSESQKHFNYLIKNLESQSNNKNDLVLNYHLFMSFLGLASLHRQKDDLHEAFKIFQKADKLLKEKKYLIYYQQYYWQEKADLEHIKGNFKRIEECLQFLGRIKSESYFNHQEYENWLKNFQNHS